MERLEKIGHYISLLPYRVKEYGYRTVFYKLLVDVSLKLGFETYIPPKIRWRAAHQFHTTWKLSQKSVYGVTEYNHRIDQKSLEVLNEFYEVGTDFQHKTFLDVGCGTRGVLPIIKAGEKIGVDPTIGRVNGFFDFEPGIIYIGEKAEDLSLASETVDIVCCNNTLNHVENPDLVLAQIHRVLKPGGMLLIEVFIEPMNIAHTFEFNENNLLQLLTKYFTPIKIKHEQLKVKVEIDEKLDGKLPMRWGGIFRK